MPERELNGDGGACAHRYACVGERMFLRRPKGDGRACAHRHACEGEGRCAREESDKRRSRRITDLVDGVAGNAIRHILSVERRLAKLDS
jgi:hypothetical protein